jgi:hypothetical protein
MTILGHVWLPWKEVWCELTPISTITERSSITTAVPSLTPETANKSNSEKAGQDFINIALSGRHVIKHLSLFGVLT